VIIVCLKIVKVSHGFNLILKEVIKELHEGMSLSLNNNPSWQN
jgi:hypothetical protein